MPPDTAPSGDQDRIPTTAACTACGHSAAEHGEGLVRTCLRNDCGCVTLIGPSPTAATERATAITSLFRRLREQGFRLTKDDHMDITLTDAQRAHVEKLIAANTDTGAEPLTVEQWVQGIVDDTLAKHEQTGQSYG